MTKQNLIPASRITHEQLIGIRMEGVVFVMRVTACDVRCPATLGSGGVAMREDDLGYRVRISVRDWTIGIFIHHNETEPRIELATMIRVRKWKPASRRTISV